MKTLLFVAASLVGACSWTTFDDLSDQTPRRATEKPDGVKSSDYAVAIAGSTLPAETSGGKISILSSGPGNYSTLKLDPGGIAQDLGDSEALGIHTIDSITAAATLLFDGTGQIALVDNSNVGTVIAVTGTPDALSLDQQISTAKAPEATAFVNGQLIVGVTADPTASNIFSAKGTSVIDCRFDDDATPTPAAVQPAAVALTGTTLLVYTKTGSLFSYDTSKFDVLDTTHCVCSTTKPCASGIAPKASTTGLGAAAHGGHIDIAGSFAIVTAFDVPSSSAGQVQIVSVGSSSLAAMGSPLLAKGVRSATFDTFDGQGLVVLGYPNRDVGSTTGVGAVDLHTFDMTTGAIAATASDTLTIPNADSNHVFGRSVTTTRYNGKPIVVVAANSVVYSFYATALYAKR